MPTLANDRAATATTWPDRSAWSDRSAASGSAWKGAASRATAAATRTTGESRAARTARPGSATRLSASAGAAARLSASPRAARLRSNVDERPLVVMVPALVETNRLFLALAHHAHHAAGHGAAEPRGWRSCAESSHGRASAAGLPPTGAGLAATGAAAAHGLPALAGNAAAHRNGQE